MISKRILIIGAGLAGSMLSWRLFQSGHKVTIVDSSPDKNTSRTAAGLINPITGMRLVKTKDFDHLYAHAIHLYQQLTEKFSEQLFYPLPMLRLFKSEKELAAYQKRKLNLEYTHLLGEELAVNGDDLNAPLGGVFFNHSGYLNTKVLLDHLHGYFQEKESLCIERFQHADLQLSNSAITWKQQEFDHVIFCEGYHLQSNPWFNYLPLQGAKGEILNISIPEYELKSMLNRGEWLVPRHDGTYDPIRSCEFSDPGTCRPAFRKFWQHHRSFDLQRMSRGYQRWRQVQPDETPRRFAAGAQHNRCTKQQ